MNYTITYLENGETKVETFVDEQSYADRWEVVAFTIDGCLVATSGSNA
jgi:hypothetical protein